MVRNSSCSSGLAGWAPPTALVLLALVACDSGRTPPPPTGSRDAEAGLDAPPGQDALAEDAAAADVATEDAGSPDAGPLDQGVGPDAAALRCQPPAGRPPDTVVAAIAPGANASCAVYASGAIRCIGGNPEGQLGDGVATHQDCMGYDCSSSLVRVSGINDAESMFAGNAACALRSGGRVSCWGLAALGTLGDGLDRHQQCGQFDCSRSPVDVTGLSGVIEIDGNDYELACARLLGGEVRCWGTNSEGQLGNGPGSHTSCAWAGGTDCSRVPVPVSNLPPAIKISVGGSHVCALLDNGRVYCWGSNVFGQLGDGTPSSRPTAAEVPDLLDAVDLESGYAHTCVVRRGGTVECWGWNSYGQLGDGVATHANCGGYDCSPSRVVVSGVSDVVQISGRHSHTCVRHSTGRVSCWGAGEGGALGDGTTHQSCLSQDCSFTAVEVSGLTDAVDIQTASYNGCALRADCSVVCWGFNHLGELGDGTTRNRPTPVPTLF